MPLGPEMLPRFRPGNAVPARPNANPVVAGRFVSITADKDADGAYRIDHTGAGLAAFGVVEQSSATDLVNEPTHSVRRDVNVSRRGSIARVETGGAIAAGAAVKSDANGKAVAQGGTGVILGYACNTTTASGQVAEVDLV